MFDNSRLSLSPTEFYIYDTTTGTHLRLPDNVMLVYRQGEVFEPDKCFVEFDVVNWAKNLK